MFGVAASIRITRSILPGVVQEANLRYWPTVVAVLESVATLQGPYAHQHIFQAYIP